MGLFDLFKDPAEYERIQAKQAVDLAEASDVATIVEIKTARARLAEATAALGEREQSRAGEYDRTMAMVSVFTVSASARSTWVGKCEVRL